MSVDTYVHRPCFLTGTHRHKDTLPYAHIRKLSKDLCLICNEVFLMNIFCKTN